MRFLLVDGTNVVMRYAFAMLPDVMSSSERAPLTPEDIEKVMSGVEHSIRKCAETTGCTHAIITLDSNQDSWRKAIYPEYKKSRPPITSEWSNRLQMYLNARGWLVLRQPSYEADDIIATLSARLTAAAKGHTVLSGDSDLLALASSLCTVVQFGRGDEPRYVPRPSSWVVEKYGVTPNMLRLYKALVGESGDGIPGVRGIGPKKALKILAQSVGDHEILRGLVNLHSGTARMEFDQMLACVTLNAKVPIDPIAPSRCVIPTEEK